MATAETEAGRVRVGQQEGRNRGSRSSRPFDHVRITKYDSLLYASLRLTATVGMTQAKAFS